MILEFRTDRDKNGNTLYLAIDTGAELYTTVSRSWISKDVPVLKRRDRLEIMQQLERNGFKRTDSYFN